MLYEAETEYKIKSHEGNEKKHVCGQTVSKQVNIAEQ